MEGLEQRAGETQNQIPDPRPQTQTRDPRSRPETPDPDPDPEGPVELPRPHYIQQSRASVSGQGGQR